MKLTSITFTYIQLIVVVFLLFLFYIVAANSYELNNLDNEALDAPIYSISSKNNPVANLVSIDECDGQNFTSLPCETILVACKNENDLRANNVRNSFNYKNPLYQSAHVQSMVQNNNKDAEDSTTSSEERNEHGK